MSNETADVPKRPVFSSLGASQLGITSYVGIGPGDSTRVKVYLPKGNHADGSLACIFVAPAGTNLLTGATVSSDYHDETAPYAEAGFAVVQYSLDGPMPDNGAEQELSNAYKKFKAASAGMENTKRAIEFVKARLPEVDVDRMYTAGHSSAGTVSLLAAATFPNIQGAIAYAPCSDPEDFHKELNGAEGVDQLLPGVSEFDRKHSPLRNISSIKCPVFLFQADDDGVVTPAETARFSKKLKQSNDRVSVVEVARGGHYNSMIDKGIPAAIKWLHSIDGGSSSK